MILKKLKLHNIRSYTNAEIGFPVGSTLLAGDIGAGKSSILLAIEFALFGIRRGQLSGSTLLRHGKRDGAVELTFEVDGKETLVKRSLKRSKTGVEQAEGYLIQNERKKDATAIELKAMILELLGYPKELITKTKNLIYRYTVYTPQEEMKAILYEDSDARLDTLRKVFTIDKYKRIRDNTSIVIRSFKEKKKMIEGTIADLDQKKQQKRKRELQIATIQQKRAALQSPLQEIQRSIADQKQKRAEIEEKITVLNTLKKDREVLDVTIKNNDVTRQQHMKEIETLKEEITKLRETLANKAERNTEHLKEKIQENERIIAQCETDIRILNKHINEFKATKTNAEEITNKILSLDACPVCRQQVAQSHKHGVKERHGTIIQEAMMHIQGHEDLEQQKEIEIDSLKKELDELRKQLAEAALIRERHTVLAEKEKRATALQQEHLRLREVIATLTAQKATLTTRIDALQEVETRFKEIKERCDALLQKEKALEVEQRGYQKEAETLQKLVEELAKEINHKEEAKKELGSVQQQQQWLEVFFTNVMTTIEKHVMLTLHQQCDELFQNWFTTLIEDETIAVRLDDTFSPVIEQNGYETHLLNLSGGEKTSCALAYRLSLNKVINTFVGDVKTKDLIILDEPTEGFSTEQLDKIRIVLDQLEMQQVILVSHESKIESFVDKVIRINKEEHASYLV